MTLDPQADLPAVLPSAVLVAFPRVDLNGTDPALYPVTVTLASLALSDFPGQVGQTGVLKTFHDTAKANFQGELSTPANAAELLALAQQVATDFYRYAASPLDLKIIGIADFWDFEGLSDSIEYTCHLHEVSTRIQRGPWNDQTEELQHESSVHTPTTDEFPAEILSGTNPYAWREMAFTATGGKTPLTGGRAGTASLNQAWELNGNMAVPAGAIVWMRRGYEAAPIQKYEFAYVSSVAPNVGNGCGVELNAPAGQDINGGAQVTLTGWTANFDDSGGAYFHASASDRITLPAGLYMIGAFAALKSTDFINNNPNFRLRLSLLVSGTFAGHSAINGSVGAQAPFDSITFVNTSLTASAIVRVPTGYSAYVQAVVNNALGGNNAQVTGGGFWAFRIVGTCVGGGGSGSGSGSGSGGGGPVTTACCGNTLPVTLPLVVSGAGGANGTYTLTWDAGANHWSTTIGGCAVNFLCAGSSATAWNLVVSGNILSPASGVCSPFQVVFTGVDLSGCGGTAGGTATIGAAPATVCGGICGGLPSTLHATFVNLGGCACLDGVTIPLVWDGFDNWSWTEGSPASGCDFTLASSPPVAGGFTLKCNGGSLELKWTLGAYVGYGTLACAPFQAEWNGFDPGMAPCAGGSVKVIITA